MIRRHYLLASFLASAFKSTPTLAFQPPSATNASFLGIVATRVQRNHDLTVMASSTSSSSTSTAGIDAKENKAYLYHPSERDEHYQGNIAQYLLDLHNERATFDFCGGMMFQLVLTDKLRSHLQSIASERKFNEQQQPIIHPASMPLMSRIPKYTRTSNADNVSIFHGRELRRVPNANGGMGFVLQLSYADISGNKNAVDPQGWTSNEISSYDGWLHDGSRQWRNANIYESEGFLSFKEQFGKDAFGLNHRFYLHYDGGNRMWLSAEDGCEGTPAVSSRNVIQRLGGMLFGS